MKILSRATRGVCLATALAGGGLLSSALAAHPAFAHASVCRSDPIVLLSNGEQVNMVANFTADPASVSKIVYSLKAPSGATITKITYTGGAFASKEQVQFQANQPSGTYSLATTVSATGTSFTVSATDTLISQATGSTIASGTASGTSNKPVTVNLKG
jgi:hypothetical protein